MKPTTLTQPSPRPAFAAPRARARATIWVRTAAFTWGLGAALSLGAAYADIPAPARSGPEAQSATKKERVMDIAPLPKTRGFWGTFFFWSGGVLCMYLVGRRVFREQSHERLTLKVLSNEIGPFFPEFDPPNLRRWMDLAAPHLYAGWRAGDLSGMSSFSEADFIERENASAQRLAEQGRRRVTHLGAVLNIHPLGAYLVDGEDVPPKGVELQLRVELKVIDYLEGEGGLIVGEQKPRQEQWLWVLRHSGASWRIRDVHPLEDDITDLAERPPLPPIMQWVRPQGVKVTTELSAAQLAPESLPPLSVSPETADDTVSI